MNLINKFKRNTEGFINAITRFPLTILFLIIATILNALLISNYNLDFESELLSLTIGIFLSIVVTVIYERFFIKFKELLLLLILTVIITTAYYFLFLNTGSLGEEIAVKTIVKVFMLFIAFLWIPSIKSKVTFNETFMAGFKAIFTSVFYSAVIMLGLTLIYLATDTLLFDIPNDTYMHTANLVFLLFNSIYFLSLIPSYPGKKDFETREVVVNEMLTEIEKPTSCPKFLEILLSYIIIPLASIFTMILLIYIVINITGSFWQDDLLEVMLVSYIIVVIMIYILSSRINNNFTNLFRKVFPKILVVIVLFQTVNSIIRISIRGLTYGRYYVILFGIFALISGIIFSIKPVKKNGLVPMVLIICIIISLFPFIDAFSISKRSQIALLENTLTENGMLVDNKVVMNNTLDDKSKDKIIESLRYIVNMDYTTSIPWLAEDFNYYSDFDQVFGFSIYKDNVITDANNLNLYNNNNELVSISGYDYFVQTSLHYTKDDNSRTLSYEFSDNGTSYTLQVNAADSLITLVDQDNKILAAISVEQIITHFKDYSNGEMSIDESQISTENDLASIKLVFQNIYLYDIDNVDTFDATLYLMVAVK